MLVSTHFVVRILLSILQCQMEAGTLVEIYPTLVKKNGCARISEPLELVSSSKEALNVVFLRAYVENLERDVSTSPQIKRTIS